VENQMAKQTFRWAREEKNSARKFCFASQGKGIVAPEKKEVGAAQEASK
jgi:hypothetical protein